MSITRPLRLQTGWERFLEEFLKVISTTTPLKFTGMLERKKVIGQITIQEAEKISHTCVKLGRQKLTATVY